MSNTPCAACKFLRRKCTQECVFAPYFPPHQPQRFSYVHRVFGASNVAKLLNELNPSQRADAVNSLAYEAECRLRCPIYGCAGLISILQNSHKELQRELYNAKKELATYIGPIVLMSEYPPDYQYFNPPSTSNLQQYNMNPMTGPSVVVGSSHDDHGPNTMAVTGGQCAQTHTSDIVVSWELQQQLLQQQQLQLNLPQPQLESQPQIQAEQCFGFNTRTNDASGMLASSSRTGGIGVGPSFDQNFQDEAHEPLLHLQQPGIGLQYQGRGKEVMESHENPVQTQVQVHHNYQLQYGHQHRPGSDEGTSNADQSS